ncbi:YczE/YyaS/YitT family protein [Anaerosporobacter sp.]
MKYYKRILIAVIGIFFVGLGVAFNAGTLFGNDPIAILYDGMRSLLGMRPEELGLISNAVNVGMIVILFFVGKKHINIGTLIYILPFGFFISIGTNIYNAVINQDSIVQRVFAAVIGCTATYLGVALFIVADIGLDPFTGVVMVIKDKIGWSFRKTKICFDMTMVLLGYLCGGKLGVITVITIATAGPTIQFFSDILKKYINREQKV